ncbi:MAG TPA: ATP-binding protein, partial [Pyrinomonadaceae bacterium]
AFTIVPPVWQRWWFVALAALTLGAAAYALYRLRVGRLIELERVRTRIATDLHDDIGASLSKIAVLSDAAGQEVGSGSGRIAEPLAQIAGTSRELVDAMSDIVWAVNPQRDHLSDLTHRMRRFASDLLEARDIEFTFHAPPDDRDLRLGADLRREVYLIFKECVNNLVRHAGCTRAEIEFGVAGRQLFVAVRDDGRGFDAAEAYRGGSGSGMGGHGLPGMRRRAEALGGTFEIESANGGGTRVTLRVPTDGGRGRWRRGSYPKGR